MFHVAVLVLCSLFLAPSAAAPSFLHPIADLGYTKYRGAFDLFTNTITWQGIRYAAPPVGNQRWRAPIPIEKYLNGANATITSDATTTPPSCAQFQPGWPSATTESDSGLGSILKVIGSSTAKIPPPVSEDCLLLNVISPAFPKSRKLPVVIYVHGGGYLVGSASDTDFRPFTGFGNGNFVHVTIQYRLGAFGFLGGDSIQADGTANAGLLDQRSAFEWVQRNIQAFGGDPDKVTIFGQSAGGALVLHQLMLRGGQEKKPPFRAAIAEWPGNLPFKSQATLNAQFQDLLTGSNCSTLSCVRSLPLDRLTNATAEMYRLGFNHGYYGYGDSYTTPIIDGVTLKENPYDAFLGGRFTKVPILTDNNMYEGLIFTNFSTASSSDVQSALSHFWGDRPGFYKKLYSLYPLSTYNDAYWSNGILALFQFIIPKPAQPYFAQAADIIGDASIKCSSWVAAQGASRVGAPIWRLWFDAGLQIHGSTADYLFGTRTDQLSLRMKNYFISFILNLDPNVDASLQAAPSNLPFWPKYGSGVSAHNNGYSNGGGSDNIATQILHLQDQSAEVVEDPQDTSGRCKLLSEYSFVRI